MTAITLDTELSPAEQALAISMVRGLAMDAPLAAASGHQGTAMALAPLAHVLFSRVMKYDPAHPDWPDRDRFILSNGHASILQYAMLYLTGYGLELDDLRAFRQWGSATPGHPEAGHTLGVEVTTGPLGQGLGNAVGMAIAERHLRATFGPGAVDHHTWVIAGDGCLMEGVSHEAASLAGHLGLGRLICVFDDNHITIDGETSLSCTDDVVSRFTGYGWDVHEVGEIADDTEALEQALRAAKGIEDRPSLIVLRSHIGVPSPDHTDDHEAHGLAFDGVDVSRTKEAMGIPDEPFWAPEDLVESYRRHAGARGAAAYAKWEARTEDVRADPRWLGAWSGGGVAGWADNLPTYDQGRSVATRSAINDALNASAEGLPGLLAGSADLTGNTGTRLSEEPRHAATAPEARQIYFGIREHAMGAALVGMARHGGVLPVGGTFFVFLDYMRPPVRLAALSRAKAVFVYTHDSVGVGEDGPTHQPIEHLATLRAVPDLQVIRPADANETVSAWRVVVEHDGPTVLVLTRQEVPTVTDGSAVTRGAGIVREPDGAPALVLLATGSEVALCVEAAERLAAEGVPARVVSLPSWDRFAAQDEGYRRQLLPPGVPVLSVEAASTFGWKEYADAAIGIDRFGTSAPGGLVLEQLGINVDAVVARAHALL